MLDNLSIICYVFGRNFINTLIEVSLPSFLNSHSSSSKKFNLTFTFITNQDSEEYLKKCLSQLSFDYKFKIRLAENEIIYNSKRNGRDHIDIWLRELHLCSADYIFFLIPDNLYTTSFCDKIYNEIENVDFLINYPFYVAKEPLLNTMGCTLKTDIRDLAVNQSYIINLFRKFAHPLIWTWLKGNPVGLANFHNEIYISEEANQINFYNLAEHPIIFNLKKNKGYNLDFQLRSQDNYTAKFIYAESASLDTLSNQFWQIYASSYHYEIADYYRLNDLLGCCENFSDSQKIIRSFCILDNKAIEISNDCSFQKIRLAIETARTEIFLEKNTI